MSVPPPELYHYTCDHGAQFIRASGGLLKPTWHPILRLASSWATNVPEPVADALGLTSETLSCDRTANRFRVLDVEAFSWWPEWWPGRVDPFIVSVLGYPPHRPNLWWIGRRTARVVES